MILGTFLTLIIIIINNFIIDVNIIVVDVNVIVILKDSLIFIIITTLVSKTQIWKGLGGKSYWTTKYLHHFAKVLPPPSTFAIKWQKNSLFLYQWGVTNTEKKQLSLMVSTPLLLSSTPSSSTKSTPAAWIDTISSLYELCLPYLLLSLKKNIKWSLHCKKGFPVPSRDGTNQTLLRGEYLIIPGQGEFGYSNILFGDRKIAILFYSVDVWSLVLAYVSSSPTLEFKKPDSVWGLGNTTFAKPLRK
jgi:hypothetical protein